MITIDDKTKYGTKNVTGEGFRLVHNNEKVVTIVEGTAETITSTNHEVEEFETEQEVLGQITKAGLEYDPPVEEGYA